MSSISTTVRIVHKKLHLLALAIVSLLPSVVFATDNTGLKNPLKVDSIQGLLTTVLSYVVQIGTVIIVLMMVWTGFKFVLARGNPTELQGARKMLLWTIIGALVILGAQIIAMGVQSTITAISAS